MAGRSVDEGGRWQEFVLAHGFRVPLHHLVAVVGQPAKDVERLRAKAPRRAERLLFQDLFAMWHGHPPGNSDWPRPRKFARGTYEWLPNEDAFLATLVGQLGPAEIANVLTARLRTTTQDLNAERTHQACLVRMQRIGLQSGDLVGGISVADAAREVGSRPIVQQAIRTGRIRTRKVGRLILIPHNVWAAFKAARKSPPPGKVRLSSLRSPLGIHSDKLPEFARLGYIPTAELHSAYDGLERGDWYVSEAMAAQLVEDRRLGRPMPWHGRPLLSNLKQTYRIWQARQHPPACSTCAHIWGALGVPQTFETYCDRYPPLDHGAKRHMTRPWAPGLTITQAAKQAKRPVAEVRKAIENRVLPTTEIEGVTRMTKTDVTRWIARKCPSGEGTKSWLALSSAERFYSFSSAELNAYIADGTLRHKVGENGPMRGLVYVLKQQCADLRARLGYSLNEAAARCRVTVDGMSTLLKGVQWREGERVPLSTLQAVHKRIQSSCGYEIEEAARLVERTVQWVNDRIADGTIRVLATKWSPDRLYVSAPMFRRLKDAAERGVEAVEKLGADWLTASSAALLAGVSLSTFQRWHEAGELLVKRSSKGPVFQDESVKQRAATYWHTVRFKRAKYPAWYLAQYGQRAGGIEAGARRPPSQLPVLHHQPRRQGRATHLSKEK